MSQAGGGQRSAKGRMYKETPSRQSSPPQQVPKFSRFRVIDKIGYLDVLVISELYAGRNRVKGKKHLAATFNRRLISQKN
jgi:hypothetical protein